MITIILLSVLSGKLDDPSPAAQAAVSQKLDDSSGWPPRDLPVKLTPSKPEPAKPDPKPPTPIKAPSPKPKPPVARTSPVYYLPDYSGKKWYGPDLNWLRTHIANVNAAAAARYAPVYQPVFQYGSPCANGSCPR